MIVAECEHRNKIPLFLSPLMFDDGLHPIGAQKRPPLHRQLRLACDGYSAAWELAQALAVDPLYESTMEAANSLVVNRMGYSDHGRTHALVVATNAMMILQAGFKLGWEPTFSNSAPKNRKEPAFADSAVIVALGSLLHDCGNSIARERHWEWGVSVAQPLLESLLARAYPPARRQKIILNILEVVYTHDQSVQAYSLEGSIVKIADGMDCEAGRSRLPAAYLNPENRHHRSSDAIDFVHLGPVVSGQPMRIWVELNDKAGLFQLEEVLAKKIESSVLKKQVLVEAFIDGKRIWGWPK